MGLRLTWEKFEVLPSYGNNVCQLTWKISGRTDYAVYLYRSNDGHNPWKLITPEPVSGWSSFQDNTLTDASTHSRPYYRGLAVTSNNEKFESPIIAAFSTLAPRDMQLARAILYREHQAMSVRNGVRIMHYRPLADGVPCPAPCEEGCYGQIYQGGFARPMQTWMTILERGPLVIKLDDEGLGSRDENALIARMLAYPQPIKDDLIVMERSDERFIVADTIEPYYCRGVIPVAFKAKLVRLDLDDSRYKVPVPPFRLS